MIIYSNSCSFGVSFHGESIYPELLASQLNAKLINDGIPGSCNRRIIRSSLRTLIELRRNNNEPIIALIGLSFISRTELWQPHLSTMGNDGDFHPITSQKILDLDWSNGLLSNSYPEIYKLADAPVRDYYKQWLIHYNEESAITELVTDLIMFIDCVKSMNISPLIFSNCQRFPSLPNVDVSAPFLSSLHDYLISKKEIINPWDFCFSEYALSLGHLPIDKNKYGLSGHPNQQAHNDFATFLHTKLINLI
jgi:hypothetical protein